MVCVMCTQLSTLWPTRQLSALCEQSPKWGSKGQVSASCEDVNKALGSKGQLSVLCEHSDETLGFT
jgi:hypothetical protein